jgi:hypothetical protein
MMAASATREISKSMYIASSVSDDLARGITGDSIDEQHRWAEIWARDAVTLPERICPARDAVKGDRTTADVNKEMSKMSGRRPALSALWPLSP